MENGKTAMLWVGHSANWLARVFLSDWVELDGKAEAKGLNEGEQAMLEGGQLIS